MRGGPTRHVKPDLDDRTRHHQPPRHAERMHEVRAGEEGAVHRIGREELHLAHDLAADRDAQRASHVAREEGSGIDVENELLRIEPLASSPGAVGAAKINVAVSSIVQVQSASGADQPERRHGPQPWYPISTGCDRTSRTGGCPSTRKTVLALRSTRTKIASETA